MDSYFNDIIELDKSIAAYLGVNDAYVLSSYQNTLSDEYSKRYKNIIKKYENSDDEQLKFIISIAKEYFRLKLDRFPDIDVMNNPINDFLEMEKDVYPKEWREKRLKEFHEFLQDCQKKMLLVAKRDKLVMPEIICKQLIKDITHPDFEYFKLFLINEYLPLCRKSIGLCHYKNGHDIYKYCIRSTLTYTISPKTIHEYGLKIVKSLYAEHQEEVKRCSDKTSSRDELIGLLHSYYKKIEHEILPKYFHQKDIPKIKCNIKEVPKDTEISSPRAYYNPRSHTFFMNTRDVILPKCDLFSLVMHEVVPGHHFQFAYMQEKLKLSPARQNLVNNTGLVEGWAHYIETLTEFPYKGSQLFRAVRLVIDTGIHYYGWSYSKCYKYMNKYLGDILPKSDISAELKRYICMPGQALAYALGKKKLIEMRSLFIRKGLGDIKDFHSFILKQGNSCFDLIEKNLNDLIEQNQTKSKYS